MMLKLVELEMRGPFVAETLWSYSIEREPFAMKPCTDGNAWCL
jgi:hypothetical protein